MSKADKVRALLAQASTPGERAAAQAALKRLKDRAEADTYEVDVAALVLSRTPIEGWEMRLLRRAYDLDGVAAALGTSYRWNPTDDVYFQEPLRVTSEE